MVLSQEMPSVSSLKPCFHFLAAFAVIPVHLSHHPRAGYPIIVSTGVVLGCEHSYDGVVEKYPLVSFSLFLKKANFFIPLSR